MYVVFPLVRCSGRDKQTRYNNNIYLNVCMSITQRRFRITHKSSGCFRQVHNTKNLSVPLRMLSLLKKKKTFTSAVFLFSVLVLKPTEGMIFCNFPQNHFPLSPRKNCRLNFIVSFALTREKLPFVSIFTRLS